MGYTHFDGVSVGSTGLAVGTRTAGETQIIDSSGNVYKPSGTQLNTAEGVVNFAAVLAAASATTIWWVAPYACNLAGYVSLAVSGGTGRVIAVAHGSGGDNAVATATLGASGTIGVVVSMAASAVPSATALEPMRITIASCATAQTYGVTLVLTKV